MESNALYARLEDLANSRLKLEAKDEVHAPHHVGRFSSALQSSCYDKANARRLIEHRSVPLAPQIATLESELMQLMKQNGIQVNNNNSNGAERPGAQQQPPVRAAAGLFVSRCMCATIIVIMSSI